MEQRAPCGLISSHREENAPAAGWRAWSRRGLAGSGTQDDRGRLEGVNHRIGRRRALAAAVEECSPFESARTQKRIAGTEPCSRTVRQMSQPSTRTGLTRPGYDRRLAPGFIHERPPVERLMLGTHDPPGPSVGIEMRRRPSSPAYDSHVRDAPEDVAPFRDQATRARRIDNDLPLVELGVDGHRQNGSTDRRHPPLGQSARSSRIELSSSPWRSTPKVQALGASSD